MKCEKCSFSNENSAKFCENCGHLLSAEPAKEVKEEKEVHSAAAPKTNATKADLSKAKDKVRALTKVQKIGFVSVIVVVLLFAVGFAFAKDYYAKENQISRYIETLNAGEAVEIASVLSTEDLNFDITEESIQPYADYIAEDKEYIMELTSRLKDPFNSENPSNVVYLKKEGKDLFFFDHYDLVINPVYAELSTNMKDAVLMQNGIEIGKADSAGYIQKIGPLSPGNYTFASSVDQYGVPLMNEQKVFFDGLSETQYVDLSLSGVEVTVSSSVPDAKVYLNDTEIGQLKNGEGKFGPISWQEDSYLTLKKEFETETLESDPVALQDYDEYYSIDFNVLDESGAQTALYNIYSNVENVASYGVGTDTDTDKVELLASMVGGEENAMYQTLYNTATGLYNDETVSSVRYNPEITSVKQVDAYEYEATYDLVVNTNYTYDSDKEDTKQTISFKVNLVLDNFRDNDYFDAGYDVLVKSFEVL